MTLTGSLYTDTTQSANLETQHIIYLSKTMQMVTHVPYKLHLVLIKPLRDQTNCKTTSTNILI